MRGRAANPRWIAGVMRHGYKGAAEIAATVDYLFAFAATSRAVDDAHFDALYEAYLADDAVRGFMAEHNPAALAETEPPLPRGDRARPVAPAPQQRSRGSGRMESAANEPDFPPLRRWAEGRRFEPRTRSTAGTTRRWRGARRRATQVLATKTEERGLLIVHTGTGKGKSTAAFGMVLRCLGHGMRVGIVQFVKGAWSTGERTALERFRDLVTCRAMGEGFTWDTQDRARDIAAARDAWETAKAMIADPSYRLVLLDELNIVLRYDYLPLDEVVAVLQGEAARPARRRHRPQRPARTDRGRRSRHRDDPGQAPVPRRGQGAAGDRVLMARALMLQGTGSDVGKSLLVAGLARAFTRRGLRVRPFKPQNMSNNAAVTADGGEIGRAQALQARACGVAAGHRHEPGAAEAAIGRRGADRAARPGLARRAARRYRAPGAVACCRRSSAAFDRLAEAADLVLVEGAGSPAEINLRAGDIANMGFAEAADVPVVLVGDIERGGVIAQLVGTHALLSASRAGAARRLHRQQIPRRCPAVRRRHRGDRRAHRAARALGSCRSSPPPRYCRRRIRWRCRAHPSPSPLARARGRLPSGARRVRAGGRVKIAVPLLPRIANFDDLDPLRAEPAVELVMVRPGQPLPRDAALVILPGSKATLADLAFLRREGGTSTSSRIAARAARFSGFAAAIRCSAGSIADPHGWKGRQTRRAGARAARRRDRSGRRQAARRDCRRRARDRHAGCAATRCISERPPDRASHARCCDLAGGPDGAVSADGLVAGCYLHGLFASDPFRRAFLARLGRRAGRNRLRAR